MDNAEKQMASSNEKDEGLSSSEEKDLAIEVPEPPPYTIFTRYERLFYAWLGSVAAFASPVSTSIYYPALTTLAKKPEHFTRKHQSDHHNLYGKLFNSTNGYSLHLLQGLSSCGPHIRRRHFRQIRPPTCIFHLLHNLPNSQHRSRPAKKNYLALLLLR
jgi:hypothetical protein